MLPSLEIVMDECPECGAPAVLESFCAECDDRLKDEARRESGNEYRRQAQASLDLEMVRRRTRAHMEAKVQKDDVSLQTLENALKVAGVQAEELYRRHPEWEAIEWVRLELNRCYERVHDEIRVLGGQES